MAFGKKKNNQLPDGEMSEEEKLKYWQETQKNAQKEEAEKEAEFEQSKKRPKLTKEEKAQQKKDIAEIKAKRKDLKKDLKLNGLSGKADFEFFAKDLGLSYPEGTKEAFFANTGAKLSEAGRWAKRNFTTTTALIIATLLLLAIFLIAYISEERGHFTVNLTTEMLRDGFELSETVGFDKPKTRLFAKEITNSNATSIYEMNRGMFEKDGSNNGPAYMAYTFYIRNSGTATTDYGYTINILSETLNTAKATWVMVFEDDKQIVYAKATEEGEAESLGYYPEPPFSEDAFDASEQYYYNEEFDENGRKVDGGYVIVTTPFLDDYTVAQGYVKDFAPGESKKYTMVIWLEGDDPDCNNSIMGGHCGFNIQFDRIGPDETGYFKGLFRGEYDDSYEGKKILDYEHYLDEHKARLPEE